MDHQQCSTSCRGEARLALGRQPVGHEVDRLVDLVDGTGRDGIEAVRLHADRAGRTIANVAIAARIENTIVVASMRPEANDRASALGRRSP